MFLSHRKLLLAIVSLGWVVQTCVAQTFPSAQDRRAVLARQKEHYLQTVQGYPVLDKHRMGEILDLKLEGGQLAFHTSLTPWPNFEPQRVELEGAKSPATVVYSQFVAKNPLARQFEFKVEEYPEPEVYGQLHMQWRPAAVGVGGDMSIEQTKQTGHSFLRAFYMQNSSMARLLVFANDASADHNMQSFNYMEKDFATLRQRHPAEVEEWLRPMLHRLQQDAVFAPEMNAAWQVLEPDWPLNAAAQEAVIGLLPDLNSEQSRVRNHAANQLAGMGLDAATAILRLDRRSLSLEQNIRLDEVVARFRGLRAADAKRLADDPDFLLDCEYCPDPTIRRLASARLSKVLNAPVDLDAQPSDAARFEAIEKFRATLHPAPTTEPAP